ncbi:hypothetical protein J6590_008002 [Homalodisca vitripennis]|nr:hypothetical protein J6590_008002 [Homalodisca vitripennis]
MHSLPELSGSKSEPRWSCVVGGSMSAAGEVGTEGVGVAGGGLPGVATLSHWAGSSLDLAWRQHFQDKRTGATLAVTWALMELFWTNEKAAMAARPRPLPPSPPPSHTPRPLLDPLRRPPANGRAASPPPYESDGGRAMADGVMADEQKFVSPAAGIRTRAPTNARLSR